MYMYHEPIFLITYHSLFRATNVMHDNYMPARYNTLIITAPSVITLSGLLQSHLPSSFNIVTTTFV